MTQSTDWNNTHFLASLLVPPGAQVLDVGCGTGVVGASLLRAGCSVLGIDSDKEKVDLAREAGLEVVLADLETEGGVEPLAGRQFDVVLCLDVLEHLRDPARVLRLVSELVRPTGVIVVSIPNMTHGAVRVAMLSGRLERTSEGLLDRTHLYWYDRNLVEQLFAEADLEVVGRLSIRRQLDETEIPVEVNHLPDDVRRLLERDPDAGVYQFIYVACVDRSTVIWPDPHPVVALVEETQRGSEVIRSSEMYARRLEAHIRVTDLDRRRLDEALSAAEAAAAQRERMDTEAQDLLRLRTAELDDAFREITYFESELRFRDIQLTELRRQAAEREVQVGALQATVTAYQAQAEAFVADAAWVRQKCEADRAELQRLQSEQAGFLRLRATAGYRLADFASASLRSHRLLYKPVRMVVRFVARRFGTGGDRNGPAAA